MEDDRKEVDPSGQELIEGEQNGQTVQPLVAHQNDQNVNSLARENKKRKKREADKKFRDGQKQKTEDTKRQLENARANYAELQKTYDELKKTYDELEKTHANSEGKLDQAKEDIEIIKRCYSLLEQVVIQQNAWINMLQPLLVAGTINQFGATMESGGPVFEESLPQSHQVERAHLVAGTINQFGATMESGGPVFEESFPQSHQVERAHWNNVEQPGLTYGGLTYDGDLNSTSLLGAAMASGSSLMQGSLAPGGQGNNSEQPTPYNADQFPGVN